jgi:hypothetical protein
MFQRGVLRLSATATCVIARDVTLMVYRLQRAFAASRRRRFRGLITSYRQRQLYRYAARKIRRRAAYHGDADSEGIRRSHRLATPRRA